MKRMKLVQQYLQVLQVLHALHGENKLHFLESAPSIC